jgi:hypothetical protein
MKKLFLLLVVCSLFIVNSAEAYTSGSNGNDGPFDPSVPSVPANSVVNATNKTAVIPLKADGSPYNFTTVNVPSGWTVTFFKNALNSPVYILAQSDVTIAGTISVNGTSGGQPSAGQGGPGGYDGGQGGPLNQPGANGLGPGGGKAGISSTYFSGGGGSYGTAGGSVNSNSGSAGPTYGTPNLIPLIGGSGGGGSVGTLSNSNGIGYGGGGGGGALVIASSTSIIVTGSMTANGGGGVYQSGCCYWTNYYSGGGSGGSIRLIANIISGNGIISASGGASGYPNFGGNGRIRLEANTNYFTSMTFPAYAFAAPGSLFPTGLPTLTITSIGGVAAPSNPSGSMATPDVTLPSATTNPVNVGLSGSNIPIGTTVTVTVTPQYGASTSGTGTLSGTLQSSTASASVNMTAGVASVLMATATYTSQQAMYYNGEKIEKVRVATTMGGGSKTVYITESGKQIAANLIAQSSVR